MMNLKQLLNKPLQIIPKGLLIAIFALTLIGFADATYLAVEHFQNEIPPCSVGGCEIVLTSDYAQIYGVPVSLMGSIFYLFTLIMLLCYFDTKKDIFLKIPFVLFVAGALISIFFICLMLFVIKSICVYCMVSDIITITLAVLGIIILVKNKNNQIVQ